MGTKTLQAYKSKGTKTKLKKNISTYIYTTIPRSLTEVLKPYPHKSRVLKKKIKQQAKIAINKTTPPFSMHTSPSCVALPLIVCYLSLPFCHE